MALKDYVAKRSTIAVGDTQVLIRGLRVSDISILIEGYKADLIALFAIYGESKSAPDETSKFNRVIVETARTLPELTSAVIALAADEPDAVEQAKSLPFPSQIDALVKIAHLTFDEVGGLGNFLAVLTDAAASLGKQAGKVDAVKAAMPQAGSPALQ